jgi:hypothetical protein
VCKYGCANASSGTEPDTAASSPGPGFLLRHTRFVVDTKQNRILGSSIITLLQFPLIKLVDRKKIVDFQYLQ